MHNRTGGRQPVCTLVGDHKVEETPVPIPNTEVKLNLPMILLSGKVGYRRLLGPTKGNLGRASFVFGLLVRVHGEDEKCDHRSSIGGVRMAWLMMDAPSH